MSTLPTRAAVCMAVSAATLAGALAFASPAATAAALYSNFDPTVLSGPGADYSPTGFADISGYCNGSWFGCGWINVYSAGFNFTADTTGVATRAFLPLDAVWQDGSAGAAERFYRISIYNTAGELVVQGGLLGRYVPIDGGPSVYEFALTRDYESGQVLADSDLLVAGETYQAYFHQRYGRMAQTHWMSSNEAVEASDNATSYCYTNVWGVCAYLNAAGTGWDYPYGSGHTQAITGFLPALALTDGSGFTPPPTGGTVPVPGSLALAGLALAALGAQGRLRRGAHG